MYLAERFPKNATSPKILHALLTASTLSYLEHFLCLLVLNDPVETLLARLQLLSRRNILDHKHNRKIMEQHIQVSAKIKQLIEEEAITSFLALESYYSFLIEKISEDQTQLDEYVKEIKDFIL